MALGNQEYFDKFTAKADKQITIQALKLQIIQANLWSIVVYLTMLWTYAEAGIFTLTVVRNWISIELVIFWGLTLFIRFYLYVFFTVSGFAYRKVMRNLIWMLHQNDVNDELDILMTSVCRIIKWAFRRPVYLLHDLLRCSKIQKEKYIRHVASYWVMSLMPFFLAIRFNWQNRKSQR